MDGRDIGTVVAPCADLKVYLDASLRERAKRRYAERAARSPTQTLAEVEAALEERDRRDMEREVAPLRQADDAMYLDSTTLTPDEVIGRIVGWAEVAAAGLASR
jgi:cytidylate kinase